MSTNSIDASIEISSEYNIPLMLIASRRQIDSSDFGGGYVNNWTTLEFSSYVSDKDKSGNIILCRDHGGPWQNNKELELKLGLKKAMSSAKLSYEKDIEAGFEIIHIDASIDIHTNPSNEDIVDRILELYEFCWETAYRNHKKIEFEIGTEEQTNKTNYSSIFITMLKRVIKYCKRYKLPSPLFVVIQNGAKVVEMQNIGSFDIPLHVVNELAPELQVPIMSRTCRENDIYMKVHNTDYLSDTALQWYPRLGIHAANVAPEFGVIETKALLSVLFDNQLMELYYQFIQLFIDSGKWKKWTMDKENLSDLDKALIAGHYNYASPEFILLKQQAAEKLRQREIQIDEFLKRQVKQRILEYLFNFKMVKR